MKRFIAAALTLVGLVFAAGCVGAPESEGAGGNGAADAPQIEPQITQSKAPCHPIIPQCPDGQRRTCEFFSDCSGSCSRCGD